MFKHTTFFHSGAQGEERWRSVEGTVCPPRGVPSRHPPMHRIAAAPAPTAPAPPLRARAACVHARLPRSCAVCLPSLRFLCAVRPFHLFASPCAQVLTTAPCTSTWLDLGAAGLLFGCSTARLIGAGDVAA